MHRLKHEMMSILPGSIKPKRHIGPYPVSSRTRVQTKETYFLSACNANGTIKQSSVSTKVHFSQFYHSHESWRTFVKSHVCKDSQSVTHPLYRVV